MIWDRWIDNWYATRESFFADAIPFYPARVVIFNLVYRKLAGMLYTKGITRHSKEDIQGLIAEAAKAMSVLRVMRLIMMFQSLVTGAFGSRHRSG